MINQLPAMGFTILKDPNESARKDNIKKKEFLAIETFTGSTSGATTVIASLLSMPSSHALLSSSNSLKLMASWSEVFYTCLHAVPIGR